MGYIKQTIAEVFIDTVKANPESVFVISREKKYTYRDIYVLACIEAEKYMSDYSLGCEDFVALYAFNSLEWIVSFFALQMIGVKTILLNHHYKYDTLMKLIEKHKISCLLYSSNQRDEFYLETLDLLKRDSGKCVFKDIGIDAKNMASFLARNIEFKAVFDDYKSLAVVIFTSGSTGEQKGVMLSHYSLLNNAKATAEIMEWNREDISCVSVPFFHCFGLTMCILTTLVVSSSLSLVEDVSTESVCQNIEKNKCTVLNGVPTMFLAMLHKSRMDLYDLSSIKSGIIAGSPIYADDYIEICRAMHKFNLQPSYGQSEASPCITICSLDDSIELKSKSAGRAIPDVDVRIRDLDTGEILSINQLGEVETRGYNVMLAYLNDEDATKAAFTEDNWLKTGDIGSVDADGNLYIKGRKKNIIIRAGENISPAMVENSIKSFYSDLEVVVLGVKSKVLQEEVVACIVNHGEKRDFLPQLKEYLSNKLPSYAVPRYFLFFDEFERTAIGKVDFSKLSDKVEKLIQS